MDRYASLAISMGSSMVIARLLTPSEIGVYSVTMVMLMFASAIRDMGAGSYLVQERELTTERIRAVWAVQLGLGCVLAMIVLAASYPVALFYKESRMRDVMMVIALNYAINPFGSLTYAWLMREMRFDSVAIMRFSSAVSGAVVSIGLAWHGFGPISLAFGSLTTTLVNALVAVYFRPSNFPWMPGTAEIRRVLAFGSKLSLSSVIGVLVGGAPELLLGKLQSLTAAGLYSRAGGLVQMFNRLIIDAVGSVCLPWFSKEARERGGFADPFLNATAYVTALGWSFCFAIIFLAHPVMNLLYGNQWNQSVDLARLLAVSTALAVPSSLCHIALLSSGGVALIARLIIVNAIATLIAIAIGAPHGLLAVGAALIVVAVFNTGYTLHVTFGRIGVSLAAFLSAVWRSLCVALVASSGPVLACALYGFYPSTMVKPMVVSVGVGLPAFLIGLFLFKHPLRREFEAIWGKFRAR